jgi:sarcosine oxidase gamma subunit
MVPSFDIFRTEAEGSVLWCGSATTMEEAEARVREFAATSPGEYLILSHRTGNKLTIKADGAASGARASDAEGA